MFLSCFEAIDDDESCIVGSIAVLKALFVCIRASHKLDFVAQEFEVLCAR